jgi:integrase
MELARMATNMKAPRQRFKILKFLNPRTETTSWRVSGIKRNGERIRENFADPREAQYRYTELEGEFHATNGAAALRATRLTDEQIAVAEAGFKRLERDEDLLTAIDHWLRTGKPAVVKESPRLDDALKEYTTWMESTKELRPQTKKNLRRRVTNFVRGVGNKRVIDVVPEHVEHYLAHCNVAPITKDAERRAISSFFVWCMKGKRHWAINNPCYAVEIEGVAGSGDHEPVVLPVDECEKLLRAAERAEGGRLAPYIAICMFGGLRPFEAARLNWEQVNLADGEIRLRGGQTKTGAGRTVQICPTLRAWLRRYRGRDEIYRPVFEERLRELRAGLGYGKPKEESPDLKPWVPDVLRHTAISHYFRATGSYGRTAEQFGNSESIIKKHYQSRVSSKDTKRFYALRPLPAKPAKRAKKRVKGEKRVSKHAASATNLVPLRVDVAA